MRRPNDGTVASSGQIVHVHHALVTAMLAGHEQATDAMPAHAAEIIGRIGSSSPAMPAS
jgi:hypothetical protein